MSYKEELQRSMLKLAETPGRVFLGYGLYPSGAAGTFKGIDKKMFIEYPVAEGVLLSSAIGFSLAGLRPLVFIERFDFIMNGMDAIVNHLDKLEVLSRGKFKPAVIIRVLVGSSTTKLPFTGPTHIQDFTDAFRMLVQFPVVQILRTEDIYEAYGQALERQIDGTSTMIVEYKDLY